MENTSWVFSPSEAKFYFTGLHDLYEKNDNCPADAVAVTADVRTQFNTPPEGKMLGTADGMPVWVDVPPPTHEEYVARAETEKQSRLDDAAARIVIWQTKLLMGRALTPDETASLNSWMDYIDAVTAIDTSTAPDINWPEIPAA